MIKIHRILIKSTLPSSGIHTCSCLLEKYFNVSRQAKIFGKLVGERKSGSKRRWYPNEERPTIPFDIAKPKKQSKTSIRRVAVLSKLFMRHITDLMATGEASEEILGKGLEISKVKVHPDFHGVNVFWVAKGDENDDKIEEILKKCSGVLRHELSQLRLMGEVPKITFVKDKFYANVAEVQNVLKKCDFGEDYVKPEDSSILHDFPGYSINENLKNDEDEESLPLMRHDVFGLDYSMIMDKILGKMKKSKLAWEKHERDLSASETKEIPEYDLPQSSTIEDLQRKLEESKEKEEEFQKALKLRRVQKNSAGRRDYEYYEECTEDNGEENNYWSNKDEGDYIEEDEKCK